MTTKVKRVQVLGGAKAALSSFIGRAREIIVDITENTLTVHDGVTPGGRRMLPEDGDASQTVVMPTGGSAARTQSDMAADRVNVLSFILPGYHAGIRAGTDTHDHSAAFIAAAAALAQGGIIYAPRGSYNLNSEVLFQNKDITVEGDGAATLLRCIGGGLRWYQPTVSSQRVYFAGLRDVRLSTATTDTLTAVHMEWGYLGSSQHRHYDIRNVIVTVDNVNVTGNRWARGVYLKNAWGGEVTGLIAANAIDTSSGTALFFDGLSARNLVSNAQVSYWDACYKIGYDAANNVPCEGIRFIGCEGIGCDYGYDFWLPTTIARPALAIDVIGSHASATVRAVRMRNVYQSSISHNVFFSSADGVTTMEIDYCNDDDVTDNSFVGSGGCTAIVTGTGGTCTIARNRFTNYSVALVISDTWYLSKIGDNIFNGVVTRYGNKGNKYPSINYNYYGDDVAGVDATPKPRQVLRTVTQDPALTLEVDTPSFGLYGLHINTARAAGSDFHLVNMTTDANTDSKFRVRGDGVVFSDGGTAMSTPADYAEMIREWWDRNPTAEDRVGRSVVLVRADNHDAVILPGQRGHSDARIRLAADFPELDPAAVIGVVSGNPAIMGGAAWNGWAGRYLLDSYNRPVLEDVEALRWIERVERPVVVPDRAADPVTVVEVQEVERVYPADAVPPHVTPPADAERITLQRRKVNPDYYPAQDYTPRAERPEWAAVGLLGRLWLRPGDPVGAGWLLVGTGADGVEEWLVR